MRLQIYTRKNISDLDWNTIHKGNQIAPVLGPMVERGSRKFIENSDKEIQLLRIEKEVFPLSISDAPSHPSTYLVSSLSQYFDLAKEEVQLELKGKRSLRAYLAPTFLNISRSLFQLLGFEKVVFVNNWVLSTNLYPSLSPELIPELRQFLQSSFPKHAIVFRSVNAQTDRELWQALENQGAKSIISRPVLMLDSQNKAYQKKRMFKMDRKLWQKQDRYTWQVNPELNQEELKRVLELYEALYREKYSSFNPSYTQAMLEAWYKESFMDFHLLREGKEIVGFTGLWERNGVLTTPFIGYDQDIPIEEGIYRFLNLRLLEVAEQKGLLVNMSSGAAHFKRLRGGKESLEYNVAFDQHLARWRRWPWSLYRLISEKVAIPTIQKYGL